MEAGEPGTRQSGLSPASNPHPSRFDYHPRDNPDRSYRDGPNMAAAALMSPSTPYHPHHPPPFPSLHHPNPNPSVPSMISPVDSRRTSDDGDMGASHRLQSLPSIKDVIGGSSAKPSSFSSNGPTTMPAPQQSLPSPFPSSAPARPFAELGGERHPSPRALHPTSSFPPRTETMPAFSDPARPPLSVRPPPPPQPGHQSAYLASHPSPPTKADQRPMHVQHQHHDSESRQIEGPTLSNGPFGRPPSQPPQAPFSQPGSLPPGQQPLPGFPISPRHAGPSLPSPFDSQRSVLHPDDPEFVRTRNRYETSPAGRQFEAWTYAEQLARIGSATRTIFAFAEQYGNIAREEHSPHPIPARLPSEREVTEMMTNAKYIETLLDGVRNLVQQTIINEQRHREGNRPKPTFEDEDVGMYGDGMKSAYGMTEVKKRRGVRIT